MILDILKTTNRIVLGYLDENLKPFINVWFSDNKVIKETKPEWDGVTFHDIDMYKENKKKEPNKSKTLKPPYIQDEKGFV